MILEKEAPDFRWYRSGDHRLRLRRTEDGRGWTLWVASEFRSVGLIMAVYDFVSWCERELVVAVKLDRGWRDLQGFTFELDAAETIAHETLRFVVEWGIEPDERAPLVSPGDWYSED